MEKGGRNMAKWLQSLEKWVGGGPGGTKRVNAMRWLLLIGGIGLAIMILNSFIPVSSVDPPKNDKNAAAPTDEATFGRSDPQNPFQLYEEKYESKIKEILEKIVGVSAVDVLVTIDSTEEVVVKDNRKETQQTTDESDKNGARRHVTDITRSGEVVFYEVSGDQTPIIIKKIKPKIRGVLIVAKGAENLTVKKLIFDAVGKGLSVAANRISIVPRKQQ